MTEPKERPILFSGPMVRAILGDMKTQTRREVNPQPTCERLRYGCVGGQGFGFISDTDTVAGGDSKVFKCPHGEIGDRLWVRENGWERPERTPKMMREGADTWEAFYYDADGLTDCDSEDFKRWGFKRRPSIHMPRWASRITLEITGVRVERLNEISEEDAIAEGIESFEFNVPPEPPGQTVIRYGMLKYFPQTEETAAKAFSLLWASINGPDSWAANPWVWVIEFKRVTE